MTDRDAAGDAGGLVAVMTGFARTLRAAGVAADHDRTQSLLAALAHLDPGGDGPLRGLPPSPETVVTAMQRLADEAAWDDLRRAAAIGRMAAPDLDPDEAAWMDATMFARWMVDSFPSPARALGLLRRSGAHDAADRIEQVLERLDPPPLPDAA